MSDEDAPPLACGDDSTHRRHFWQNPHDGRTYECPGHTQVK